MTCLYKRLILVCMLAIGLAIAVAPDMAMAQTLTCTDQDEFDYELAPGEKGIVTVIAEQIQLILDEAAHNLFNAIIKPGGNAANAIYAAAMLYVAIYGAMVVFGVVQLSLGEGLLRLIKMAVIFGLLTSGWEFFNETVVPFFNNGTDEIINIMTGIALGDQNGAAGNTSPLLVLDKIVSKAFSAKMAMTLFGALTTPPYGPGMLILLGFALVNTMGAIFSALRVYIFSIIAKALLFGLAPIFITFLLFTRTKHIFEGWLNQLIGYSLQPILLFAFLGFYFTLMDSALETILKVKLCFAPVSAGATGIPMSIDIPRFVWESITNPDWNFQGAEYNGQAVSGSPVFPMDIVDILVFLLLANLAWRFTQQVASIARELSNATVYLNQIPGSLAGTFDNMGQKMEGFIDKAAWGKPLGGGQRGEGIRSAISDWLANR